MGEIIRDSILGQLLRLATNDRVLQYFEEKSGFECPWNQVAPEITAQQVPPAHPPSDSDDKEGLDEKEDIDEAREEVEERDYAQDLEKSLSRTQTARDDQGLSMSRTNTITRTKTREQTMPWTVDRHDTERDEDIQREQSAIIMPTKTTEGDILV